MSLHKAAEHVTHVLMLNSIKFNQICFNRQELY
jgi:hypothetical protein